MDWKDVITVAALTAFVAGGLVVMIITMSNNL